MYNDSKKLRPAVKELRKRIAECRAELLKLLDDWHFLQNVLHPRLIFSYDSLFGDLEYEVEKKTQLAQEIERRVELLSKKIQKGEKINAHTIKYINSIVDREFHHTKNIYSDYSASNDKPYNDESGEDVSKIYRNIVKRLHPDLNGNSEVFNKFWHNVQDAYRRGNLHRLRLFHETLCSDEDKFSNFEHEEQVLRQEIRKLEININEEKTRIRRLKFQEPFCFEDKMNDEDWVNHHKNELQNRIFMIDNRIKRQQRLLTSITGSKEAFSELVKSTFKSENEIDYFQNTYVN